MSGAFHAGLAALLNSSLGIVRIDLAHGSKPTGVTPYQFAMIASMNPYSVLSRGSTIQLCVAVAKSVSFAKPKHRHLHECHVLGSSEAVGPLCSAFEQALRWGREQGVVGACTLEGTRGLRDKGAAARAQAGQRWLESRKLVYHV